MNKSVLILGREPSVWLALVAAAVQAVSAFCFHLTDHQQTSVNAVAAGVAGLIVACIVHDGVVAAVTGLFQAGIACGMDFGLGWGPDKQTAAMLFVGAFAAAFVRTQVAAPVSAAQLKRGVRPAA